MSIAIARGNKVSAYSVGERGIWIAFRPSLDHDSPGAKSDVRSDVAMVIGNLDSEAISQREGPHEHLQSKAGDVAFATSFVVLKPSTIGTILTTKHQYSRIKPVILYALDNSVQILNHREATFSCDG
jgi:hypothetical protein